jgi:hypothetical protein
VDSEKYVYVFVRTDLPIQHQIVQSNHAVYHMASLTYQDGTPNIVLIGMPDKAALQRVLTKLKSNNILHYSWTEPDYDLGLTAVATGPLYGEQREALRNYRLYNSPVAKTTERLILNEEDLGEDPSGRANAGGTATSAVRP